LINFIKRFNFYNEIDSIEKFIKGDNLCQAFKCIEKIFSKRVEKTLNNVSTATRSNNNPGSSKDIDKSKDSKAASTDLKITISNNFL